VPDHPDEERFETYLKQFRPLAPDELLVNEMSLVPHRHFGLTIRAAGVVAIVILAAAGLRILNHRRAQESYHTVAVELPASAPLTMRRANGLLATAPSYKAVMNELTFSLKSSPVPKDKQSALTVLGKEKIKL
jgi:hypothetical protein